jgi:transposase
MSENEHNPSPLSTRAQQSRFALELARGLSIMAAADAIGISRSTAYRWAGVPNVQRLANHYRQEIASRTIGRLAELGTKAVDRLEELLMVDDPAITLKGCLAVIEESRRISSAGGQPFPYILDDNSGSEADKSGPVAVGINSVTMMDGLHDMLAGYEGRIDMERKFHRGRIDAEIEAAQVDDSQ